MDQSNFKPPTPNRQTDRMKRIRFDLATGSLAFTPPQPQNKPPDGQSIRRSLIFHCYPLLTADWQSVCMSTFKYRDVFNGRLLISITSGEECERPGRVIEWFSQFGSELEYKIFGNDKSSGINSTFRDQLNSIKNENGIVLKAHTKGITHVGGGVDPFGQWRDNMAHGCLSDIKLVERKFNEGYKTFGVFKATDDASSQTLGQISGQFSETWSGWHYPGAFYWFRPRYIPDSFFQLPLHHYENESFPYHIGPSSNGFSLTPDNTDYRRKCNLFVS